MCASDSVFFEGHRWSRTDSGGLSLQPAEDLAGGVEGGGPETASAEVTRLGTAEYFALAKVKSSRIARHRGQAAGWALPASG